MRSTWSAGHLLRGRGRDKARARARVEVRVRVRVRVRVKVRVVAGGRLGTSRAAAWHSQRSRGSARLQVRKCK